MAYLPVAQETTWQQSDNIDLTKTAVLVVDVLGGSNPAAALEPCASDYIIPKRRYDGFFQTDLDLILRELGVDTLIVVGADTNICVLQTLAGAYFRGYKTIVAADATATFLIGTQEYALDYFSRCYDSRVVDTAHVLAYLAA